MREKEKKRLNKKREEGGRRKKKAHFVKIEEKEKRKDVRVNKTE